MRLNLLKSSLKTAVLAVSVLLLGAGVAAAQVVNLTAGPSTLTTPDGATVPMWGYSCGAVAVGSTATCASLHPGALGWSPVVITVPTGANLQINLTNNLMFGANKVPTSLVIVGQLGGGLGTINQTSAPQNYTPAPDHSNAQATTWPIAPTPPGAPPVGVGTPPAQFDRVQSFSTQVEAGTTTALTWTAPRPGTYLIESGTHPSIQGPMGLYGILVVTAAPSGAVAGTAYPGVTYAADVPLLLSEIDPVQNTAVNSAVNTAGFSETRVWSGQPGGCGNPGSTSGPTPYLTCYPPAVNYSPLYYLFNGVALDKTNATASLFKTSPATGVSGTVLVRLVNAGLRMHVPSIVGAQTGTPPVPGFGLIAEDGNPLPGVTRVQNEVFLAPGKTYDVAINAVNVPASAAAFPIYDRELSLSGNATARDAGMLAYIGINGLGVPAAAGLGAAVARDDTYNSVIGGQTFTVSDPGKGVIANDTNVSGVQLLAAPAGGTLTLNGNGTFTYVANAGTTSDSFTYCANGSVSGSVCSSGISATVTLGPAPIEGAGGIILKDDAYAANATSLSIASPGVLVNDRDTAGYPLKVVTTGANAPVASSGLTLSVDASGAFHASATSAGTYTFTYHAQNSQGTVSASAATATIVFPSPSHLAVTVLDGHDKATPVTDYRWIIEEDRTFYIDPKCTTNPPPAGCPTVGGIVPTFGTNFHTSYMPVVAAGCVGPSGAIACESGQTIFDPGTGTHVPAVCDVGNGVCRPGTQQAPLDPGQVHLDPTKRYYISVLPGDAGTPFETANASGGHGMGGAPIAAGQTAVTIYVQPTPFPTAKLSVFVFQDDFPLNGEQDAGGGIDVLASNEPGLGSFNITLFDDAGGTGDATGQMTYDMFNQPLVNSLAGTPDPATQLDACPISKVARVGDPGDLTQTGITGTIVTCPKYESDGKTLSPLAGQALIANMMPGRYGVVATPAADRIARGEEWLQTNTLDGQKAHDSFLRIGEPSYFQEFGPAGYHVSIGFANPAVINARRAGVCGGTDPNLTASNCTNTVKGLVTTERTSRTPDERLYSSGSYDSFSFTQCFVSLGDTDGEDFMFTKCNPDGTFTLTGVPTGNWRVTVFDQWNDMLVDGLSTPVGIGPAANQIKDMGQIGMNQWQANLYTATFFDTDGNGVRGDNEAGLTLLPTNIRFRDGSYSNFNNTDLNGNAGFNEVFPLFSWYVVESDTTRYKNTGTHIVYDAGGPADGTTGGGTSTIAANYANTIEQVALPINLRVPGARYCASADCPNNDTAGGSTGRVDPAWVETEGWQGFSGQNSFIEFGKRPIQTGETGGIHGEVIYASTRPFDDPSLLIHTSWTPDVPGVTMNLYQEGTAPDGSTSLKLVDTTTTSSWDDWAQGFRSDGVPNMNCPGQGRDTGTLADLFFFTLYNQPMWLDAYNNNGVPAHSIPNNSEFKCYDGLHNWNQLQPAPYDGKYEFPSIIGRDPLTGAPTGTGSVNGIAGTRPGSNCTICVANPVDGTPMLPTGKYVVEMIVPPGYELVKEEDKNILIGDNYIAPVTVQFPGLGSAIYILPDQAEVAAEYNANNAQNPTTNLGSTTFPRHEGDTGSVEEFWPCVGAARVVPDFISLFPQSLEVAPFAGATRNLCDRKEVTVSDQESELAKFWIFTSTHVAAHFTGVITDDFTSEFDPFSPQFGEKFSPPNMPISFKDWTGTEVSRVYSDQWGTYDGLTYSTWEVNPPNPTGYAPTMMVTCMNDPGTGTTPDPLFNPEYSQFCYEIPFMPGQTQYMDTPVVPTSAFAGAGYNNPDCALPASTPAIAEVDGDGIGPWVSASGAGHNLTITALGDQVVPNNAYSGPAAATPPFNQKTVTRHYGFGGPKGTVTIGGMTVPASTISWSDSTISFPVPAGIPTCSIQQQTIYGGPTGTTAFPLARCGELVITTAAGVKSTDTITVTVGGKAPTHVAANASVQDAIDAADPGDLLILNPAVHQELLVMWKPLRLQGVGAASSVINANAQPAGKLDPWRAKVNCLFGLALNGQPLSTPGNLVPAPGAGVAGSGVPAHTFEPLNLYDPTGAQTCGGWTEFKGAPNAPQVDRIPLEGIVGWDTTLNGNLAQLLQEPTLMGAYEGAGITVLARGVKYPSGPNIFGTFQDIAAGANVAHEGQFPVPSVELQASDCLDRTGRSNPYPSNFMCNPSRIDGLTIEDSSQGGGGIFAHGWAHFLEISNNRVINNTGTLTGGITIGQGESPDALLSGNGGDPIGIDVDGVRGALGGFDQQPWTCNSLVPGAVVSIPTETSPDGTETVSWNQVVSPPGQYLNKQLPYCYNIFVNVHNNEISRNSSIGDELFSGTPAGAGGITFATGSDSYTFKSNFVCGNLSTGDGGGVAQLGFSWKGDIENNQILFNQSTNATISTNGGGLVVMGAAPDGSLPGAAAGTECGSTTDVDCAPGLSDGTGPGLTINANLIMGNSADSGSGGGIRLQDINGTEVALQRLIPSRWNAVSVTNNIIVNNVAGWDGAGVSLQDALVVNLVNNTIMHNDSTASAGVLFDTLGAPLASVPPTPGSNCHNAAGTASCPQVAGLATTRNTTLLSGSLAGIIPTICPAGHFAGLNPVNGTCKNFSFPLLYNNVFWQNRSFYIGVGSLGTGTENQQNVVSLYNAFGTTRAGSQTATGSCPVSSFWDIGVRGDTGPTDHSGGTTLSPQASILTSTAGYPGSALIGPVNTTNDPAVNAQYCNGSRVPPEFGGLGYNVPPGIADATVPNPIFNLTPAATVDEGNNWINLSWGPLAQTNPVTGAVLGNYTPAGASSGTVNKIPPASVAGLLAPLTDFFGVTRRDGSNIDIGAVEFRAAPVTLISITPATGFRSSTVPVTITGTNLGGATAVTVSGLLSGITVSNVVSVNATTVTATFTIGPLAPLNIARDVTVTATNGTATLPGAFTVIARPTATLTSIAPNTGVRGNSVPVTLTGTNLTGATAINVSGTGIVVSGLTVVNSTTVTATFQISGTATVGARNVSVVTPLGTTNNVTFTLTAPPAPALAAIAATSGVHGTTVPVTLTGTNLTGASSISISGGSVHISNLTVVNDSTVTANFAIDHNAARNLRTVTIKTPGGQSNAVSFTVQ